MSIMKCFVASVLFVTSGMLHAQSITSIAPNSAQRTQSLSVMISGEEAHFAQGSTTVWLSNGDLEIPSQGTPTIFGQGSPTSFGQGSPTTDDTFLAASFDIPGDALIGPWDVNVESSGEDTLSLIDGFTIEAFTETIPGITSITPDTTQQGESLTVAITGQDTHFTQGTTTVWLSNGSSEIFAQGSSTIFSQGSPTSFYQGSSTISDTLLAARFEISQDDQIGSWDVNVESSGEDTLSLIDGFTITSALSVTSPVSNELWAKGQTYDIEWSTGNPSPNVKILLFKGDSKVLTIKKPTANDYTHSWKIPTSLSKGTNYRIKVVCLADKTAYGYSDFFEIAGPIPCVFFTPIEVSEPSITTDWQMGKPYSIRWTGGEPEQNVKILLFKGPNLKQTITASTPNDGEHDFTMYYGLTPGSNYRVKVKVLGSTCSSLVDFSDTFEIKAPEEAPEINVEVPDSTSVWVMGGSYPIMWSGDYFPGGVKIKLFKGSTAVKTISNSTDDDGNYTWAKVPYSLSSGTNYRVKIVSLVNNKIKAFSEPFEIAIPPMVVVDPNSSTQWKRGVKNEIRWTGGKPNKSVKIQLLKGDSLKKTLTTSTANDGLFKWKVPSNFALGDDYSIRVIYLPNTTMRGVSGIFEIGTISDHVFEIEMSLSYDFGEGYASSVPVDYEFDAWMRVGDTVVSGTVETPEGVVYQAAMEVDDGENWLGIGEGSASLDDLADFTDGIYIFTVTLANGKSKSTSIPFESEDGSPIPLVEQVPVVTYQENPLHNATGIPLTIYIDLDPLDNFDGTYGIEWFPVDDGSPARSGELHSLPPDTTRAGPLKLSPDTLYEIELTADHAIWSTNDDGIPYVVDKDSEVEIIFTTVSTP